MNEFLRLEREAKRYKEQYPKGTRLELISMEDPQAVPPRHKRYGAICR